MLWWEKNRIYNYQLASFYSDYISEELDVIKKINCLSKENCLFMSSKLFCQ